MAADEYRQKIEKYGYPLIEGQRATFYWFGDEAPLLMGDFCGWEDGAMAHLKRVSLGVWAVTLEFRPDTYMEYSFYNGEQRVADPLNPRTTPDGFGHENHYFYMPEGQPTPLAKTANGFPRGRVGRYELPCAGYISGKQRALYLYQPPVEQPVPVWVVWDGPDYLRRASLVNIIDNLIGQGRIQPVALAMLQNAGPNRALEYGCSDNLLMFTHEVLLPFAAKQLNLIDVAQQPGAHGVMGASMGGLMALYAGLRMPEIFGRVLSQSGAFRFGDFDPVVVPLAQHGPCQPVDIWMDAGIYEWLLEPNRRMAAMLKERGYAVAHHEFSAGHNYPAWRDDCARGLEHLLKP